MVLKIMINVSNGTAATKINDKVGSFETAMMIPPTMCRGDETNVRSMNIVSICI